MCFSKMNWTEVELNASSHTVTYDYPASYEELEELYKKYNNNQAVSDLVYWILIAAYSILIILGCIGNLGVIIAVAGNRSKSNLDYYPSHF